MRIVLLNKIKNSSSSNKRELKKKKSYYLLKGVFAKNEISSIYECVEK